MPWKVFIESKPWSGALNVRIGRREIDGMSLVQQFTFKKYPPHSAIPDDEVALSGSEWAGDGEVREFLQAMADAAWDFGIRPAGAKDLSGELKATRDHLSDMRSLALTSPVERKRACAVTTDD